MAKTRVSSRRPKSALDRERYTAELSTMQLVIGVCLLLMFGLGCFLIGVLIGKFDPSLTDQLANVSPQQNAPEYGLQNLDAIGAAARQPNRPAENAALPPEMRPPQNLVAHQSVADTPQEQPPAPVTTPTQGPTSSPESATTTSTAATIERPGAPEITLPDPPTETPKPQPAAIAPPLQPSVTVTQPAAAAPATSPQGIYGVQIIAVARPRADAVKRDIETRSSYKAEVIPIDADRLCKVVVGRFQDERSALAARDDLRSRYAFKDAYVISLK